MSNFKVKNLMIGLAGDLEKVPGPYCCFPTDCLMTDKTMCPTRTVECPGNSLIPTRTGCGMNYSTCIAGTGTVFINVEDLVVNPVYLEKLQQDLDAFLNAVRERASEVEHEMKPQNMEQVQFLKKELGAAQKELEILEDKIRHG